MLHQGMEIAMKLTADEGGVSYLLQSWGCDDLGYMGRVWDDVTTRLLEARCDRMALNERRRPEAPLFINLGGIFFDLYAVRSLLLSIIGISWRGINKSAHACIIGCRRKNKSVRW